MIWLTVTGKLGWRDPFGKMLHFWRGGETDVVSIAKWFLTYFRLLLEIWSTLWILSLQKAHLRAWPAPNMWNKAEVHWSCHRLKTCFDIHFFKFFTRFLLNFPHFYCKNNFSYHLLQTNFDVAGIKHWSISEAYMWFLIAIQIETNLSPFLISSLEFL